MKYLLTMKQLLYNKCIESYNNAYNIRVFYTVLLIIFK